MNKKIEKMTQIAIFSAIIVILQLLATYINFGTFSITLTLIPIIIAGAVFGVGFGTLMGLVFGLTVTVIILISPDPSSALMLSTHPFITISIVLLKGTLAGFVGALAYKLLSKKVKQPIAITISAALAPITNTLVFCLGLFLFFETGLKELIGIVASTNFIVELLINVLLGSGLTGLITHWQNRNK